MFSSPTNMCCRFTSVMIISTPVSRGMSNYVARCGARILIYFEQMSSFSCWFCWYVQVVDRIGLLKNTCRTVVEMTENRDVADEGLGGGQSLDLEFWNYTRILKIFDSLFSFDLETIDYYSFQKWCTGSKKGQIRWFGSFNLLIRVDRLGISFWKWW